MGKRIIISFFIVATVFGVAYWTQKRFFATAPIQDNFPVDPSKEQKDQTAPEPLRPTVLVASVENIVERRRGIQGQWDAVQPGDKLGYEDAIRTRKGGRALLTIGDAITVEVADRSQFAVSEITDKLSNIRLEGGRISARVAGGGASTLKVVVKGSQAVAEASAGEFSVLRTEDARVTVATKKGQVKLSARGQSVEVGSGQQSVVAQDATPSAPTPIPTSLFLKINTATPRRLNKKQTDIEGVTSPGAVVTIRGVNIPANTDGVFRAAVPLQEGANQIVVVVEDALGRSNRRTLPPVFVDTRAPKVKSEVTW